MASYDQENVFDPSKEKGIYNPPPYVVDSSYSPPPVLTQPAASYGNQPPYMPTQTTQAPVTVAYGVQPGVAHNQTPYGPTQTNQAPVTVAFGVQPGVAQQVTVITQGPSPQNVRDWSSSIIGDCCKDCSICCCVFWCGMCVSAQSGRRLGEHCCYGFMCPLPLRTQFRAMYGLKGSGCNDCCCFIWCTMCVMCQLARELDQLAVPGARYLWC